MPRPPVIPAEKKIRVVLSIIAGEVSIAEAARNGEVCEQSIGRWKVETLEAGNTALIAGKIGPRAARSNVRLRLPTRPGRLARQRSRSACGRRARRAGGALRGPRGDPRRCGQADLEVLLTDRQTCAGLAALAGHGAC
jgi:transposase